MNTAKVLEANLTLSHLSYKTDLENDELLLLAMQLEKPLASYDINSRESRPHFEISGKIPHLKPYVRG